MTAKDSHIVTITLIAKQLGLTPGTVSSVLNGQAQKRRISKQTAQEVMHLAEKLDYVPNDLARSLRLRSTGIIGVIFANHYQGWSQRVLDGMTSVFDAEGYVPFTVIHRWNSQIEAKEILSMLQHRVEGILCIPLPTSLGYYEQILRRRTPLVFFGDTLEEMPEISYIIWDSEQAARIAVQQLIGMGRRRISFLGANHKSLMTKLRYKAYETALLQAGLPLKEEWISWQEVDHYQNRMLEDVFKRQFAPGQVHPNAIFALNDNLALGTMEVLNRMGIRIPQDVALIGMGDLPEDEYNGIGLSTMREPCEEIGRAAAQAILDLIRQPSRGVIQKKLVANDFKNRRTTHA